MAQEVLTVRCVCGWETTGSEAVVVPATIEHGRRLHNMEATREQVLAMAVPAPDGTRAVAGVADTGGTGTTER